MEAWCAVPLKILLFVDLPRRWIGLLSSKALQGPPRSSCSWVREGIGLVPPGPPRPPPPTASQGSPARAWPPGLIFANILNIWKGSTGKAASARLVRIFNTPGPWGLSGPGLPPWMRRRRSLVRLTRRFYRLADGNLSGA